MHLCVPGSTCEDDVDECVTGDLVCESHDTVCVNTPGDASCQCDTTHYVEIDEQCVCQKEITGQMFGKMFYFILFYLYFI